MKYGNNKYEDIKSLISVAAHAVGRGGYGATLRCVRICAVLFIFTI